MQKVIIPFIIMLCANLTGYAQADVEQTAMNEAGEKHKIAARELKDALSLGAPYSQFNNIVKGKQFLLEEKKDLFKDILGYNDNDYAKKNDFLNVFNALTSKVKSKKNNPAKVIVEFSDPNSEDTKFLGNSQKKNGAPEANCFDVSTKAEVKITTSNEFSTSVAKNYLTMYWKVNLPMKNGQIDTKKKVATTLIRYEVKPETGLFVSEKQQIKAAAEAEIKKYYQNLKPNQVPEDLKKQLNDNDRVIKIETPNDVNVALPSNLAFSVSSSPVKVNVDPDPYMPEGIARYETQEASYTVPLSFDVTVSNDLTNVAVSPKFGNAQLTQQPKIKPEEIIIAVSLPEPTPPPVEEPVVKPEPVSRPVPKGEHYKVQIYVNTTHIPLSGLPAKYRGISNISVEKYFVGGTSVYKYVVSAANLGEAFSILKQMNSQGIADAWIAVYEEGTRIRPADGKPEIVE